jgi:adenylate kinase family enzyme
MVILITGATHTGKTFLAQRLLEKYNYPYLSVDHLKMGLIRSGNTCLTPLDDEELTLYLWPILREMIKTVIENHQNLIVEGCYIPFDWRLSFEVEYQKDIRFICITMSENYIENHYSEIIKNASIIESRLDDNDCSVEFLQRENKFYREGFCSAGENVFLIDGDYQEWLNEVQKCECFFRRIL